MLNFFYKAIKNKYMKFFYPDTSGLNRYTDLEQEGYYCTLRDFYVKDPYNGKLRKNINIEKRIYSINIPVDGLYRKYTVGENCVAIFVTVDWIIPPTFIVHNVAEFTVPVEFLNNTQFNVECFEGYC